MYEHDARSLHAITPILKAREAVLLNRITRHRKALEEEYAELDLFKTKKSLEDCIEALHRALR